VLGNSGGYNFDFLHLFLKLFSLLEFEDRVCSKSFADEDEAVT
jgi:hypothetical protein